MQHNSKGTEVNRFHAQIKQSPPITLLHTLSCPVCRSADAGELRLIRAHCASDAVLELITTYMTAGVRRRVDVCSCTRGKAPAAV